MDLPGYDSWKLASPPEDEELNMWLESLTFDEVMEICGDEVVRELWEDGDDLVVDRLIKHYSQR